MKTSIAIWCSALLTLASAGASAELLFHESFDYANDSDLHDSADWGGAGAATQLVVKSGDTGGDNGGASLGVPGIEGSGGRLIFTIGGGDGSGNYTLPAGQEVTGDNAVFYWSLLYKPISVGGNSYFMHNRTDGSTQAQMGRLRHSNAVNPNENFAAGLRDGTSQVIAPGAGFPVGTTIFLVTKTTIVPGDDNDTFEVWINPTPGSSESTATMTSLPDIGNNLDPVTGFQGVRFRVRDTGSSFEADEFRVGTTWADVTSELTIPPPPAAITPSSPFAIADDSFSLSATADGTGYQWSDAIGDIADGGRISGATTEVLTINPLAEGDAGTYTITYEDGEAKTVVSASYVLFVYPSGTTLPLAGLLGLGLLASACAMGGALVLRRKK